MDNLKDESQAATLKRLARRLVEMAALMREGRSEDSRSQRLQPRDRLIVALDLPSVEAAQAMVARLGDAVSFYKIGYQLAFAGGLSYAQALAGAGKRVFLDLKLHDIGNTVAQGVKSVARLGATLPHRARLSADHAGGGRSARGAVAHPRRHGAHLLRRRRPQGGGL